MKRNKGDSKMDKDFQKLKERICNKIMKMNGEKLYDFITDNDLKVRYFDCKHCQNLNGLCSDDDDDYVCVKRFLAFYNLDK